MSRRGKGGECEEGERSEVDSFKFLAIELADARMRANAAVTAAKDDGYDNLESRLFGQMHAGDLLPLSGGAPMIHIPARSISAHALFEWREG